MDIHRTWGEVGAATSGVAEGEGKKPEGEWRRRRGRNDSTGNCGRLWHILVQKTVTY